MWVWCTDRDQTKDITGVHRSYLGKYVPPSWCHVRVCCVHAWASTDCGCPYTPVMCLPYARQESAICQAYALITPCRRICPQCTIPTEQFSLHHAPAVVDASVRHLEDMLVLPDAQRQDYSFLCAGDGWLHGPLAIATVDPAVLRLDMHSAPPDRWHGVVDMIDDLTGAVRNGLKARKQAEVCARVTGRL